MPENTVRDTAGVIVRVLAVGNARHMVTDVMGGTTELLCNSYYLSHVLY